MNNYSVSKILLLMVILSIGVYPVIAQPAVSNVSLYFDDNGGVTTPASALTPTDEETLSFQISHGSGLSALRTIDVYFYHSNISFSGSEEPSRRAHYTGTINSGQIAWNVDDPHDSSWGLDENNSTRTLSGGAAMIVSLVFTPARIARFSGTTRWRCKVKITDSVGATNTIPQIISLNAQEHIEVYADVSSLAFVHGTNNAQKQPLYRAYNQINGKGYINLLVYANVDYKLLSIIDHYNLTNSAGYVIYASNIYYNDNGSGTVSSINPNYKLLFTRPPTYSSGGDIIPLFLYLDYIPHTSAPAGTRFHTINYFLVTNAAGNLNSPSAAPTAVQLSAKIVAGQTPYISPSTVSLFEGDNGVEDRIVSYLTAGNEQTLRFYIHDNDGVDDISQVKIIFWKSDITSRNAPDDNYSHATYVWQKGDAFWNKIGPAGWGLDYVNSIAIDTANTNDTSSKMLLVFTPSVDALPADKDDWTISIIASSDNPQLSQIVVEKQYRLVQPAPGDAEPPLEQQIFYAWPSPFTPTSQNRKISFNYYVQQDGILSLKIYDISGSLVKIITTDQQVTGKTKYTVAWDTINGIGAEVLSGVYYAELEIRKSNGTIERPNPCIFTIIR